MKIHELRPKKGIIATKKDIVDPAAQKVNLIQVIGIQRVHVLKI